MSNAEIEDNEPLNVWAIIGLNALVLIVYIYMMFQLNLSDSAILYALMIHLGICISCALYRKGESVGWWVSSLIVAFPLTSLLVS